MFSTKNLTVIVLIAVVLYLVLIGLQVLEWRHYSARPAAAAQP